MVHARDDYNKKSLDKIIPADEPVFLLRAGDKIAARTVRFWADKLEKEGGDPKMAAMARAHADRMEKYKPELKKLPDLP
jgi:hypothetical protein